MNEIRSLTALRGIAAMAVVMQHFSATAQLHASTTIPSLVPHGYVAVDFFFVLSGYIMCYTYLRAFQQQGWRAYRPFLAKRAVRLLPLNVFVTLAILAAGAGSLYWTGVNPFFGALDLPRDIVVNLFMVQGLGLGRNLNGPSWSVSAEFIAYAAFPLLVAAAFSRHRLVTAGTLVVALALLVKVAMANPGMHLTADGPLLGGLRCISEFTLGMLAYRFAEARRASGRWAADGPAIIVLAACGLLVLLRIDLLTALSFPLVVAVTAANDGRATRWLAHPLPYFLGEVSYSLYLIHDPLRPLALNLLRAIHPEPLGTPAALVFAFAASAAVVPFAWLTYRLVEHPAREALKRRVMRRIPRDAAA